MAEDDSAIRSMTVEKNCREVAARRRAPAKPTSSYTEFNAVDNSVQSGMRPGNRVTVRDLAAHDAEIIKAERPSRKVEAAKAEKKELRELKKQVKAEAREVKNAVKDKAEDTISAHKMEKEIRREKAAAESDHKKELDELRRTVEAEAEDIKAAN